MSTSSFFMPPDSNWKMPLVSPRRKSSSTRWSSRGILSRSSGSSTVSPAAARLASASRPTARKISSAGSVSRISFFANSIVESVRSPRKSILRRPTFSQVGPSHCVTASSAPPAARQSGTMSSSGRVATMTPAACTPWLRAWSSSPRAWSNTRAIFGSAEIICAIFGSFAIASSMVMSSSAGMRFARF